MKLSWLMTPVLLFLLVGALLTRSSEAQTPTQQIVPQACTSACSNLVHAKPGYLYSGHIAAGATPGCLFIFNATSLPANGTVSPYFAPIPVSANATISFGGGGMTPIFFTKGVVFGFSTTCGFTFTASATVDIDFVVQ